MAQPTPEDVAKAEAVLAGDGFRTIRKYTDPKLLDFDELIAALNNKAAINSATRAMERNGMKTHPYLDHIKACETQLKTLLSSAKPSSQA